MDGRKTVIRLMLSKKKNMNLNIKSQKEHISARRFNLKAKGENLKRP
jgi:hypothetical protein